MKKPTTPLPPGWFYLKRETGLWEMICPHDVGHPVRESAQEMATKYGHDLETQMVHGCEGCCGKLQGESE